MWSLIYLEYVRCVCVWVKFYLRQNKGCSPGDSTLDSSEKLPQRGSGGSSIYMFLVKEEFTAIKSLLYKRFSACHEELMSSRRDLVLSWTCGDARIQIMKSVPENIYLAKDLFYQFSWSTKCLSLHPELLSGHIQGQQLQEHRIQSAENVEADGKCPWQCQFVVDRFSKWS